MKEDIYLQKIKATSLFKNNMELLQDFEIAQKKHYDYFHTKAQNQIRLENQKQ